MWFLAYPKIGEREVVAALLEHNHHLIDAMGLACWRPRPQRRDLPQRRSRRRAPATVMSHPCSREEIPPKRELLLGLTGANKQLDTVRILKLWVMSL